MRVALSDPSHSLIISSFLFSFYLPHVLISSPPFPRDPSSLSFFSPFSHQSVPQTLPNPLLPSPNRPFQRKSQSIFISIPNRRALYNRLPLSSIRSFFLSRRHPSSLQPRVKRNHPGLSHLPLTILYGLRIIVKDSFPLQSLLSGPLELKTLWLFLPPGPFPLESVAAILLPRGRLERVRKFISTACPRQTLISVLRSWICSLNGDGFRPGITPLILHFVVI